MKKHKFNLSPTYAILRYLSIKLIIAIIGFLLVCFIVGYLGKTLKTLDYFKIKDIVNLEGEISELSYLKGQNIFDIDLKKESRYILELYPNYKKIRLIKVLPNRLFVDFIKRDSLGLVKLYRYFCVDEDSILFDTSGEIGQSDLPIILGLDTKIFGPKSGRKYNIKELTLALNIIKELKANRRLKDYRVKTIDVANPASASFFMDTGLEVKLGEDDIKDKIGILAGLLIRVKNDLDNIRYIDLRFKDPVIKLKDK